MIWNRLKYFSEGENWGDPRKINGLLLLLLEAIRDILKMPIVIHCGTQGKHVKNSQHYLGNAVDFHIVTNLPYRVQVKVMESILEGLQVDDRVGFGIYPEWNHPGFHLDVRGERARWGMVGGRYVSYEEAKKKIQEVER